MDFTARREVEKTKIMFFFKEKSKARNEKKNEVFDKMVCLREKTY